MAQWLNYLMNQFLLNADTSRFNIVDFFYIDIFIVYQLSYSVIKQLSH